MNFNLNNLHTIFEEANEAPKKNPANDETGSNLDNTLGDADLPSMFDDICPITGDVYAAMKDAAKDPKNLKITAIKDGKGTSKLFIEAVEFITFIEATGMTVGEAAEEITSSCGEDVPELDNAEFHVVFPSDSLNKGTLGGENLGLDCKADWPMQLLRGCRRYGLKVNAGVEKNDVANSAPAEVGSDII